MSAPTSCDVLIAARTASSLIKQTSNKHQTNNILMQDCIDAMLRVPPDQRPRFEGRAINSPAPWWGHDKQPAVPIRVIKTCARVRPRQHPAVSGPLRQQIREINRCPKNGRRAPELRYDQRLGFVTDKPMAQATADAARREMTSMNSWMRKAILSALAKERKDDDNKQCCLSGSSPGLREAPC
jgi:hypothetical protein